jgi:hypothetical protein
MSAPLQRHGVDALLIVVSIVFALLLAIGA